MIESPEPLAMTGIWDGRRRALRQALGQQDELSAQLYERAITALGESPLQPSSLVIASHCIRELVNRLGRVLGDSLSGQGFGLRSAVEELVEVWNRDEGRGVASTDATAVVAGDVRTALEGSIEKVIQELDAGRASAMTLRSVLAVGNPVELDNPTVRRFKQSTDAFERFRHPQGNTDGWPPDVEELAPHLRVIEDIIEGRVGSFFAVAQDVRALLVDANTPGPGGTWEPPTAALFDRIVTRIGDLQHRRVFFAELLNPLWVEKLHAVGALNPPSPPLRDERGWLPWPAGPYLVRVAGDNPRAVAKVIEEVLRNHRSREVLDVAVKSVAKMPPDVPATLAPTLRTIPKDPLDPVIGLGLVGIVETLEQAGHETAALRIATALLRPRISHDPKQTKAEITSGIERYWYAEALQRVTKTFAGHPKLLPALVAWLHLILEANGVDPTANYDLSVISRPWIGDSGRRHGRDDITQALVDAVRDAASAAVESASNEARVLDVLELLERRGYPILGRIARFALASWVVEKPDLIGLAHERLLDRGPLDGRTTPREYLDLARATLPLLDDRQFREWETLVLVGPDDNPSKRERMREHLEPGETEAEAWSHHADRWLLDILGTIGVDSLRGDALSRLEELTIALGEPYDPSPGGVRVFEMPPSDDAETARLRQLSVDEVLAFARNWTAPSNNPWDHLVFDAGEAFATVIEERAAEFALRAFDIFTLQPMFVGRFCNALRSAIDTGVELEWGSLLQGMSLLPPSSSPPDQLGRGLSYPIQSALYVIQAGQGKSSSGFTVDHVEAALDITLRYLDDPDPVPDNPSSVDDIEGDPVTAALNAVQPVAIATSVRLAHFAQAEESTDPAASTGRVVEALGHLLAPERVASSSAAAAFGSSFGQLFWLAPEWVETRKEQLLSDDWFGDVVSSVALLYYARPGFFSVMHDKLSQLMSRAADGEDIEWAWTQREPIIVRLGEYLLLMLLTGDRDLSDDLVSQYLRDIPARIRGTVLCNIGQRLGNDHRVPDQVLERARVLWDSRAEHVSHNPKDAIELSGFHSWVHSGKFAADWWLPRLRTIAATTDLGGVFYLGEHLVEAAKSDPGVSLEVLGILIGAINEPWARYELVDHAPRIIASGLLSGDKDTEQAARDLMDYLGRAGHLHIPELVDQARQRMNTPI